MRKGNKDSKDIKTLLPVIEETKGCLPIFLLIVSMILVVSCATTMKPIAENVPVCERYDTKTGITTNYSLSDTTITITEQEVKDAKFHHQATFLGYDEFLYYYVTKDSTYIGCRANGEIHKIEKIDVSYLRCGSRDLRKIDFKQ